VVTGQDVVDKAAEFIGQRDSNGIDGNGPHPWAFWCEAFVEMVHEQLGLHRVRRETALAHAAAVALKAGRAPIGAMVFFGTEFFQDGGHVAISTGDGGCIGTVTDGMGVDRRQLNETTRGYLGWAYHPGVRPGAVPQPSRGRYAVAVGVANIRQGPGRRFPVVGTLAADAVAAYDRSEAGEPVDGNPWWLRLRDRPGWIHSSLVMAA
jgi:hypothetical protein